MVPANCTVGLAVQAETLRPPLAEELPKELPVELEEDSPNKLRTICSLLLGARLNVISCAFEPWLPTLRETCSPPPLVGLRLIVICSGLLPPLLLPRLRTISGPLLEAAALEAELAALLLLLRLRMISGPLLEVEPALGEFCVPAPLSNVLWSVLKAAWAPARSPDCRACPMAVKSCSRWGRENGSPLANGPLWPSWIMLL